MDAIDVIRRAYAETTERWEQLLREFHNKELYKMIENGHFSIFYNDPFYTLRKSDIYLMGLNPGGDTTTCSYRRTFQDIEEQMANYRKQGTHFSAYLDEDWRANCKNGEIANSQINGDCRSPHLVPHQRRVCELIKNIAMVLDSHDTARDVFAANLIFFRTKGKKELQRLLSESKLDIVDYCYKQHKRFIGIVQPKILLCNVMVMVTICHLFRS